MSNGNGEHKDDTKREKEVPIIEDEFATLLGKFKIKPELATNIAENISHTGGPTVFEDPVLLTKRLSAWSGEIAPAKRKLIIEQWFAERGIEIEAEVLKKAGLTSEEMKKEEKERGEAGKVLYRYDPETDAVVMAKPGEGGGTLAQAKQLKLIAEESAAGGKESPFIMDKEGTIVPNPKAKHGGIEIMAYEVIKKAQAAGESVDPLQAMIDSASRMQVFREALGVKEGEKPNWMTDPAEFIKTIQTISGGEGGSKELRDEISSMRQTISDMKDEKHREQIEAQQGQINLLSNKIGELTNIINDPSRRPGAKNEMDVIAEIVETGKEELKGFRQDIRSFVSGQGLPGPKLPQDREGRKERYRKQIASDKEIEELGTNLFLTQS